MSWTSSFRARARLIFARRAADARMREEMSFHLEMETDRLVREEGLPRAEARRRALVSFGGVTQHQEIMRADRGFAWLGGLSLDVRLAGRMLVKHPGLAIVGVLGMAVAIAIGAVSFSVVRTLVDGALPFSEGDRIIAIRNIDTHSKIDGRLTHLHYLAIWCSSLTSVRELGAYRVVERNAITSDGRAESESVAEMTASGFRIARVPPLMGRYLTEDDERGGASDVAVIGYDLWRTRFASRPDIVGQTIQLGPTKHTIVGVMPKGFAFPVNNALWTPLRLSPSDYPPAKAPRIDVFGRLAPHATIADARRQAAAIVQRLAAADSATYASMRTRVVPYTYAFIDNPDAAWTYYLAQLLVTGLLVVIGTNVAVLVYARTASRIGEIAIRTALGASRARVVAQLFAEALAMSAIASATGLIIAELALVKINAAVERQGTDIPFWFRFHVRPDVVAYCAALAVLAAVIVGVIPGLKATAADVRANLQHVGAGGSGIRLGKGWTVMIVSQVAIAVAILPLAFAGTAAWARMQATRSKLAAQRVLTMNIAVDANDARIDSAAIAGRYLRLRDEFVRRVEAQPGVSSVSLASSAPGGESGVHVEVDKGESEIASEGRIDARYLSTFGIPVLSGRAFEPADFSGATNAVLVNRSFVREMFDGRNPLGARVRFAAESGTASAGHKDSPAPWQQIVGVIPDFPADSGSLDPKIYRPLMPTDSAAATLAVRFAGAAPISFINPLRALALATNPSLRLSSIEALEQTYERDQSAMRLLIVTIELVTAATLLLSAAGIYALMAFTVTRRRREIGLRSALGAEPRRVLVGVLSHAMVQLAAGAAIGIGAAWGIDHALKGGWTGRNAAFVLPTVIALMVVVGLAATFGPALRALRIPPTEALKAE